MTDSGDGFWGRSEGGREPDSSGAAGPNAGLPATPAAESALVGFITGGLPGLLGALDARAGASFEDDVEDPEALRRAEDAVKRDARGTAPRPGRGAAPIDESWAAVATQVTPGDTAGLDDVMRALESEGVDCGWDPYDPRDTVNFLPPTAGMTARKLFSVTVPVSQVPRAREALYGDPPDGVTYVWPAPGSATQASTRSSDADFGFSSDGASKRRRSEDGVPLSDNERFQRMASRSPSVAAAIVLVFVVVGTLIGVGAVLFSVLKR
jgi:hypothetical protein